MVENLAEFDLSKLYPSGMMDVVVKMDGAATHAVANGIEMQNWLK